MAALSLHSFSLLVLVLVSQDAIPTQAENGRLCGAELVEALYETCKGKLKPREATDGTGTSGQPKCNSLVVKCCYQPCSLDVLEEYCAEEPGSKKPSTSEEPVHIIDYN